MICAKWKASSLRVVKSTVLSLYRLINSNGRCLGYNASATWMSRLKPQALTPTNTF